MKPKLLVIGAVVLALAVVTAIARRPNEAVPAAPPAAMSVVPAATPAAKPTVATNPELASYRVSQDEAVDGVLPYRGANYKASIDGRGLSFEAGTHKITLGASRIEQGASFVQLPSASPKRDGWAKASIDRSMGVTEEFVFENRRVEHLVRVDRPLGEGALTVRMDVETSLKGAVQTVRRGDSTWRDMALADGGLVFTTSDGKPGLSYHGAVAIDAQGRKQLLDARWENGQIALEVPASFMKDAAYPVLIDPWLELDFSGSGGGVTLNGSVSETPAVNLMSQGSNPCVAWSDESDGDFDIYFKYWNGFEWVGLGTSATSGGISANGSRSTNPSIGFHTPTDTAFYHPFIAWEDDLSGTTNVFARFWTGSSWAALDGSASGTGVSLLLGTPARNPQAIGVNGLVANDALGTVPPRSELFPCIFWEIEEVAIVSKFFYPGDNRDQAPPEGWYDHPSGFVVVFDPSATRPSVARDTENRTVVAFEGSTGAQMDIFVARSPFAASPPLTPSIQRNRFSVAAVTLTPTPANPWVTQNACLGLPAALSIQPAIAADAQNDVWVAWQETAAAEREIYVRRSAGGAAAYTSVAGSAVGGGISASSVLGTQSTSSFPSISIDPFLPARPIVVWEDDAGGNLDVFVRRLNDAQTTWEQVADEGSATLVAPEVTGNPGGISRTPSFSLRPKVAAAPNGTITVAWRDGAAGTFDLLVRRYHDNQPLSLGQAAFNTLAVTPIAQGGTSNNTIMQFSATIIAETSSLPTNLRLQLEIRPNDTDFTGQPTHESLEVTTGSVASVLFTGLPNVNYHWRARSIDAQGRTSPWTSFGSNADGEIDFRINSSASGAGGNNNITGSTESKDKCGLVGLELFALIGLAALARRRRS